MMLKVLLTIQTAGYSFPPCSSRPIDRWLSRCSTGYCCRCLPTSWRTLLYNQPWCGCCIGQCLLVLMLLLVVLVLEEYKGRQNLWRSKSICVWTFSKTVKSNTGSYMSLFIFSSVTLLRMIGDFVTWIINQSNVLKPKVLEVSFKAKSINYLAYADLLHIAYILLCTLQNDNDLSLSKLCPMTK